MESIHFLTAPGAIPSTEDWEQLQRVGHPPGYQDLLNQTGVGMLTGWLQLLDVDRVVDDLEAFRERIVEDWCWEDEPEEAERTQLVLLAETVNGDEMVWGPTSGFWLLPADEDEAVALGERFDQAISALFEAGSLPPLYVFADDTVEADEISLEGHALTDVAAWLKTRFGAELILAEYDGENGPALMAMAPQEKVLVTARTEDEDELLLEWHGTEQQVEAGMAELGAAFDA